MSNMGDIKLKIQAVLQELVDAGKLQEVMLLSPKTNSFNITNARFPVAILTSPSSDSTRLDSDNNERTFTYDVLVLDKKDNINADTYVEDLVEAILDKFDGPGVLGALAMAVEPVYTGTEPVENAEGDLISFPIVLKVRTTKKLT